MAPGSVLLCLLIGLAQLKVVWKSLVQHEYYCCQDERRPICLVYLVPSSFLLAFLIFFQLSQTISQWSGATSLQKRQQLNAHMPISLTGDRFFYKWRVLPLTFLCSISLSLSLYWSPTTTRKIKVMQYRGLIVLGRLNTSVFHLVPFINPWRHVVLFPQCQIALGTMRLYLHLSNIQCDTPPGSSFGLDFQMVSCFFV